MKKHMILTIALLILSPAIFAQSKHVHGEGRLDVVIDKGTISLELELPLDVLVGFERAPKNDKEKSALASAKRTLNAAHMLWITSPTAQCRVESTQVSSPTFAGGHADIDANYVLRCANTDALKTIETTLFKSFKRLYRLEVQHLGPSGQGAARLTAKNPVLSW